MGDHSLKDKVVLITGAGGGIGRATAEKLGRDGARLMVSDIDADAAEATAEAIRRAGGEARAQAADVSRDDQVAALVAATVDAFGQLDGAFNNAGIEEENDKVADVDEALFDRVMAINVKGVWLCMKYQVPQMLSQGGGAIVNTSSDAGLIGWSGSAVYTASKWGVIGLTKSAALQYIAEGIRINAVCPGFIRTPMTESRDPRAEERMIAATPAGRIGTVDEVVGAVLWLCSDEASFVVGHPLSMDGGTTSGMW